MTNDECRTTNVECPRCGGDQWVPAPPECCVEVQCAECAYPNEHGPPGLTFVTSLTSLSLPVSQSPGLRLWLPAVHTLSQNRTKGRHWSQAYRARKGEAAALFDAFSTVHDTAWPGAEMLHEARRVLALIATGQDVRRIRKPSFTRPAGSARLVIVYTRVTVSPLDAENWCGSTKGLTDCLKYALPGLLPDDAPEFVEIVHRQQKCVKRCEEGTWVEMGDEPGQALAVSAMLPDAAGLLPCPFCGSRAELAIMHGGRECVRCTKCFTEGPPAWRPTLDYGGKRPDFESTKTERSRVAAMRWNQRVNAQSQATNPAPDGSR